MSDGSPDRERGLNHPGPAADIADDDWRKIEKKNTEWTELDKKTAGMYGWAVWFGQITVCKH